MIDIYEMHLKSGVSIRHLKKLQRLGFLRAIDPENPEIAKMLCTLKKGNPLGALQLTVLAESPSLIWELGRYASKARAQVEALGDVKADTPSPMIAMTLIEAAKREPDLVEVQRLERWMKKVIPVEGEVPHQFLAARALFGMSDSSKPFYAGMAAKAFANVRRRPSFEGWFTIRSASHDRRKTFYHQPTFDL
jgi:hypothetical protein